MRNPYCTVSRQLQRALLQILWHDSLLSARKHQNLLAYLKSIFSRRNMMSTQNARVCVLWATVVANKVTPNTHDKLPELALIY